MRPGQRLSSSWRTAEWSPQMAFDVFALRERVVQEYRDYVESFVHVLDPGADAWIRAQLDDGHLWPDAVLQLNPAFEADKTLRALAKEGVIRDETARFFGEDIR